MFLDDVQRYAGVLGPLDGAGMEWRLLHRSRMEMLAAECLVEELDADARRATVEELLAEGRTDTGGGPGRSGELIALTAALLAGRSPTTLQEARAHLGRVVRAGPDAAKRALASVERPPAWDHLALMLAVPPPGNEPWRQVGWDNDELDAVLDAIGRGDPARLWDAVTPERSPFHLGVRWYALERLDARAGDARTARFFTACGLADRPRPTLEGVELRGGLFRWGARRASGTTTSAPAIRSAWSPSCSAAPR